MPGPEAAVRTSARPGTSEDEVTTLGVSEVVSFLVIIQTFSIASPSVSFTVMEGRSSNFRIITLLLERWLGLFEQFRAFRQVDFRLGYAASIIVASSLK
jgi:hypothetical protein